MASVQRISTTTLFCPLVFIIDGHEFTNLQLRFLPHIKSSDIIQGLLALKKSNVLIHPSLNSFTMGEFTIHCNRKLRRICCLLADYGKINQIIVKQARNKKNPTVVCLLSLHFTEALAIVKSDFGEQFDKQLKHLITEFADTTEDPQGLPPHRGHLDHKAKLNRYPPRQRRNKLLVHAYEELKRQYIELFKEVNIRVSSSPYTSPIVII